jgi:hypothetical protein
LLFKNEEDMYPIIRRWLYSREKNPCKEVVVAPNYSYTYAGKRRYPDLLGMYFIDDIKHFVAVEAKNSAKLSHTALRQSDAAKSFCHEVYVALPEKEFLESKRKAREQIRDMVHDKGIGILLIPRKGMPETPERAKSSTFDLELYKDAKEFFSDDEDIDDDDDDKDDVQDIDLTTGPIALDDLKIIASRLANNEWTGDDDSHGYWKFDDDSVSETLEGGILSTEYSEIIIDNDFITFDFNIEVEPEKLWSNPNDVSKQISRALRIFRGRVMWINRGVTTGSFLELSYNYKNPINPERVPFDSIRGTIKIDSHILANEKHVMELGAFLKRANPSNERLVARIDRRKFLSWTSDSPDGSALWIAHYYATMVGLLNVIEVESE